MIIEKFNFCKIDSISKKIYLELDSEIELFEMYQEPEFINFRYNGTGYLGKSTRSGLPLYFLRYLAYKKL